LRKGKFGIACGGGLCEKSRSNGDDDQVHLRKIAKVCLLVLDGLACIKNGAVDLAEDVVGNGFEEGKIVGMAGEIDLRLALR
jgi:hypothetical protein